MCRLVCAIVVRMQQNQFPQQSQFYQITKSQGLPLFLSAYSFGRIHV